MEPLLDKIPVSPAFQTLIGVAIIIFLTLLVSLILRSVVFRLIGRLTRRTSTTLDDRLFRATRTYTSLLIYILGLSLLLNLLIKVQNGELLMMSNVQNGPEQELPLLLQSMTKVSQQ